MNSEIQREDYIDETADMPQRGFKNKVGISNTIDHDDTMMRIPSQYEEEKRLMKDERETSGIDLFDNKIKPVNVAHNKKSDFKDMRKYNEMGNHVNMSQQDFPKKQRGGKLPPIHPDFN